MLSNSFQQGGGRGIELELKSRVCVLRETTSFIHVTFGLNDKHIPIQYPSWSAKGFDEVIELLIARWVKLLDSGIWLFCFVTLCQLAHMIYIANTNARIRINIFSIAASCKEYGLCVAHNS